MLLHTARPIAFANERSGEQYHPLRISCTVVCWYWSTVMWKLFNSHPIVRQLQCCFHVGSGICCLNIQTCAILKTDAPEWPLDALKANSGLNYFYFFTCQRIYLPGCKFCSHLLHHQYFVGPVTVISASSKAVVSWGNNAVPELLNSTMA